MAWLLSKGLPVELTRSSLQLGAAPFWTVKEMGLPSRPHPKLGGEIRLRFPGFPISLFPIIALSSLPPPKKTNTKTKRGPIRSESQDDVLFRFCFFLFCFGAPLGNAQELLLAPLSGITPD